MDFQSFDKDINIDQVYVVCVVLYAKPKQRYFEVSEISKTAYVLIQKIAALSNFNPHLPSGPVHPYQLDESISNFRGVWCTFPFLLYFE